MVIYLMSAISISTVFLFGCIGEIITEKSGHLNLGIPGIMCMGTFGGCFGASIYMNALAAQEDAVWLLLVLISIFFAMLFAAFGGAIYAFLTVTLRCNQNITGLALTTFGSGFTDYFMKTINMDRFAWASKVMRYSLPFADKLGWFGEIFLSHGVLVYLAIAVAIAVAIVFKRTRIGLNLRAVGENPATADAAGVNVTLYKYVHLLIGGAICGLGGAYISLVTCAGNWQQDCVSGQGWIAVALVIFVSWKPAKALWGAFFFGALRILKLYVPASVISLPSAFYLMLPFAVTCVVLVLSSIRMRRENQAPAACGVNYFREER